MRIAEIAALFAPPLRAVLTAETLQAAWLAETAGTGPVTDFGEPSSEPLRPDLIRVSIPVNYLLEQFSALREFYRHASRRHLLLVLWWD
ncbi:hypothetical protein [Streptomyces sp. NPDC001880]